MNTDLSDEAFLQWRRETNHLSESVESWRECRRRAEALERKAFEAGFVRGGHRNCEEVWQAYKEQK